MRKPQIPLFVAIAVSVFLLSFLIGRATALRQKDEERHNEIYAGRMMLSEKEEESVPSDTKTKKVEEIDNTEKKAQPPKMENVEEEAEEKKDSPPQRMLFPCGKNVLKRYSQTAVYSKTMDDWRAHTGIDFAAKKGDTVVSVCDGTVTRVYKDSFWGHAIEITHDGGIVSVYKNLDENISVKEGDKVTGGQAIALVGDSAVLEQREEEHLHFELWVNGETINPQSYIF